MKKKIKKISNKDIDLWLEGLEDDLKFIADELSASRESLKRLRKKVG